MIELNGTLFFTLRYPSELWRSDGTNDGTRLVKRVGAEDDAIAHIGLLAGLDRSLLFLVVTGGGWEVWTSDGSQAGTQRVKRFNVSVDMWELPFAVGHQLPHIWIAGALYFGAWDEVRGRELYRSDGTEPGTLLVKDINAGIDRTVGAFDPPAGRRGLARSGRPSLSL